MHSDKDRYICSILTNMNKDKEISVILNFYSDVAKINLNSKDNALMQIRLKWYLEAINNLYSGILSGHKLIDDLLPLIKKYNLKSEDFNSFISEKGNEKEFTPFVSQDELIIYSKNTSGALWKLLGKVLIKSLTKNNLLALEAAGTAYGILGLVRNYDFDTKRFNYKFIYDKEKLNDKTYLTNNLKNLVKESLVLIDKSYSIKITRKAKNLLLLNIITKGYINSLKKTNYNPAKMNTLNIDLKYKLLFILQYLKNILFL